MRDNSELILLLTVSKLQAVICRPVWINSSTKNEFHLILADTDDNLFDKSCWYRIILFPIGEKIFTKIYSKSKQFHDKIFNDEIVQNEEII